MGIIPGTLAGVVIVLGQIEPAPLPPFAQYGLLGAMVVYFGWDAHQSRKAITELRDRYEHKVEEMAVLLARATSALERLADSHGQ